MNRAIRTAVWTLLVGFSALPLYAATVAQVGTATISDEQLNQDVGLKIAEYQSQVALYEKKRAWLDQKARDMAFEMAAKEAKVSVEKYKKREIDAMVVAPTTAEIDDIVQKINQQAAQRGELVTAPERVAAVKKQATDYLVMQKKSQREAQVNAALAQKYPIVINLPPPTSPNVKIPVSPNDLVKGPENARVTIVEFTDIECPFCKRAQPTIHKILEAYPNDVKLISKDFPLPMHSHATPAAEATLCAKEQGKYWEYRAKAFESQGLEKADLLRFAKELSLNEKKFTQCMDSDKMLPQINASIEQGRALGVQSTPSFFVNLQLVVGGQPFESFKAAIDRELASRP